MRPADETTPRPWAISGAWLAEQLGIERQKCHIGQFDIETCERVAEICNAALALATEGQEAK